MLKQLFPNTLNLFFQDQHMKYGDTWIFQGQYGYGYKFTSKTMFCSAKGHCLSGHNLKLPDQKHCKFVTLLLSLPPSSHPFLSPFLVPLPNSAKNTRQRLKQMLLDVVKILKMLNLCQGCHYVNIWCHMQRRVFTSRNAKTQRTKPHK